MQEHGYRTDQTIFTLLCNRRQWSRNEQTRFCLLLSAWNLDMLCCWTVYLSPVKRIRNSKVSEQVCTTTLDCPSHFWGLYLSETTLYFRLYTFFVTVCGLHCNTYFIRVSYPHTDSLTESSIKVMFVCCCCGRCTLYSIYYLRHRVARNPVKCWVHMSHWLYIHKGRWVSCRFSTSVFHCVTGMLY